MDGSFNVLRRQEIAEQVIARLRALQERALHLELVQIANGHGRGEPVPGAEPKKKDGRILYEDDRPVYPSYGEQFAELEAAVSRVRNHARELGVLPLVEVMIETEQQAQVDGPVT